MSRAVLLANSIIGSLLLSSFQLARGYSPSVVGNLARLVPGELIEAHKEQMATRALNRLLRSHHDDTIEPSAIKSDDNIASYFNTSQMNGPPEWKIGSIKTVLLHYVEVAASTKGPPSRVAYEDLCILPNSTITCELMDSSVDTILMVRVIVLRHH